MLNNNIFKYNNHTLSYLKIGDGEDLILAFHGFGMDRTAFSDFHSLVKPHQKLVSVDLFSHRMSEAFDFSGITRDNWSQIMIACLNKLGHEKFSMMAYSLGGKVVLETLKLFPEKVNSLLLFAPDGFKRVKFYEFLSLSPIGRWTYRRVLQSPNTFLKFSDTLSKIGILPKRLNKFVHYHISDKIRREKVYDVYRIYRHFIPNTLTVSQLVEKHHIPISFVYGKHDQVIHHSLAEKFKEKISKKELINIHLLNKGHVILDAQTSDYIDKNDLWFK